MFLSVNVAGDTALYLMGPEATYADYEQIKKNMGLDRPLSVQYASFLGNILQADFAKSHIRGVPAREILLQRLPATLQMGDGRVSLAIEDHGAGFDSSVEPSGDGGFGLTSMR